MTLHQSCEASNTKKIACVSPHPITLPSGERGEGKGEGADSSEKKLSYLFAFGDTVFIPTAELSGIQQHIL
jgi:hypothetical protein